VAKLGEPLRCRPFVDTAVLSLEARVGGVHYLSGHAAQRFDVLVAVGPRAQIDLRQRVQPDEIEQIDEHAELDAIAGDERNPFQHVSIAPVLACQRLHEAGQTGPEHVEEGPRDQFADPTASAGNGDLIGHERAKVVRLHEHHARFAEQRAEQSDDEVRGEVVQVRIDEEHDVAGAGCQSLPQRVALAVHARLFGQYLVLVIHRRPG
jgi:hypothetical protein